MKQKTWIGLTLPALICTLLWGSAFPAVKSGYALFGIGDEAACKLFFAGWRFMLAGIAVLVISVNQPKISCSDQTAVAGYFAAGSCADNHTVCVFLHWFVAHDRSQRFGHFCHGDVFCRWHLAFFICG